MQSTIQMFARFGMYCDQICSGIYELIDITYRLINHQMHVKNTIRTFADGFDHRKSERNTRHKTSVHYIDMHILCTCLIQHFYLFAQN